MEGSPISDSGAFLKNLGCREGPSGLIIASVTINNAAADVVIDTGASASFLPMEGIIIRESKTRLIKTKTDTRIADNGQLDCTHSSIGTIRIWAGNIRKHESKFIVINRSSHILGYDALFGNDIIKALGINISTENGILVAKIGHHIIGFEDTLNKYQRHLAMIERIKSSPLPSTPLDRLLNRYSNVFSETAEEVMKTAPMRIQLTSNSMPKAKLRRYSVEDIDAINQQIRSMLERKIIEPSTSEFSSTCHLVPKKNGQRRLVINYIPLNRIATKDHYPLPQIADILAHLVDARHFCALDCTEGFWQIPVSKEDRHKTAFITPQGLYQFKRCPFGFTNSPAIFQRAMNHIFKDGLYKRCVIYIDDILIFGRTEEELLANLEWVLRKCDEYGVKLKLSKCEFLKKTVRFLGYQVGQGNIKPQTDKCDPWIASKPSTVKQAQAFLGYINYYSRFIENFSEKTSVIRRAIRLQPFDWTEECEDAKLQLLNDLRKSTAQIIPPASTPKQIELAVLDNSIEASCLTEDGQLIMRTSATLASTQMNYSSLEKELLALTRAYNKFGPFLRGRVTIKTSCTMLPSVLKLKEKPDRVARLLLMLPPDAEFSVIASNNVLETLQRMSQPPQEIFYTDGACRTGKENKGIASWAVIAVNRPELNCSGIIENSSNQRAEIEAVIRACHIAKDHDLKNILVVTDSKYAANAIEKWIDRWTENGWLDNKNKPVKNADAFKRLVQAKTGLEVKIAHTRGHQGDKYNELADKTAREALLPYIANCASIFTPPELQQDDDDQLQAIKKHLESGKEFRNYFLKDGVIWIRQNDIERLVVPEKQRPVMLQLAHYDPIYGAHYGVKKTRLKLNHYYWPSMSTDITKFVSSCETCQRNKDPKGKTYGKLMPIKTSSLFNRIHMDIIGPVTTSTNGYKHIVTAIDAFSRMGFARPCASATGEEVVKLLYEEIISKHGPPEHIVTDNGTQFTSNSFQELIRDLDIKHSTCCEYNPQANGMDEKFNGTLVQIIKNVISHNKKEWDVLLTGAVLAYNLTPNDSTKLSPYTIVYGRLPRGPLNPTELEEDPEEVDHDRVRDQAASNMEESRDRMAVQYNKNKQTFNFKPRDLIMVKKLKLDRKESRKFAQKWTGPHSILRLLSHDGEERAVEILDLDSFQIRRIPFSAVKPYNPPGPSGSTLPGEVLNVHLRACVQAPAGDGVQRSGTNQLHVTENVQAPALTGEQRGGIDHLTPESQLSGLGPGNGQNKALLWRENSGNTETADQNCGSDSAQAMLPLTKSKQKNSEQTTVATGNTPAEVNSPCRNDTTKQQTKLITDNSAIPTNTVEIIDYLLSPTTNYSPPSYSTLSCQDDERESTRTE